LKEDSQKDIIKKMKIGYYKTPSGRSPVEEFILGLPKADQARFIDVYDGIRQHGLNYHEVTFRHLKGKLWEIRFSAPGGGYRIAYVLIDKDLMFWLHVFKKTTQKTPKNDLWIAEKRMKEVLL
jgi:phage-related protein